MSTTVARWLVMVGSVAAFLVASKAHGRQLRLERELAGHWHVTFGAPNHPFVEALWQRERTIYWSIAAALILAAITYLVLAPRLSWPLPLTPRGERSWWGGIPMMIWPFVVAFTVTGLMSLTRLLRATTSAADSTWLNQAMWGSAGWWALTLVVAAALLLFTRSA